MAKLLINNGGEECTLNCCLASGSPLLP